METKRAVAPTVAVDPDRDEYMTVSELSDSDLMVSAIDRERENKS